MKLWNGNIYLITAMTTYQLIYDASFYPTTAYDPDTNIYKTSLFFQYWGGISQSITSNIIVFNVLYVIVYQKSFDVIKHFILLNVITSIPSLLVCLSHLLSLIYSSSLAEYIAQTTFAYIRLPLLFSIFLAHAITVFHFYKIIYPHGQSFVQMKAIVALVQRLKYYPLIQGFTRIPFLVYGYLYGFTVDPHTSDASEFALQCLVVTITPLASVGYLMLFLLIQPNAMKCFTHRLMTGKSIQSIHLIGRNNSIHHMKYRIDETNIDGCNDEVLFMLIDDDAFRQSVMSAPKNSVDDLHESFNSTSTMSHRDTSNGAGIDDAGIFDMTTMNPFGIASNDASEI